MKPNILDIGILDFKKTFLQMNEEDKRKYVSILNALTDKNFDSSLITSEVLDNENFLYAAIKTKSPHLSKFNCKIKDYYLGISYVINSTTYINFKYIDDELFENIDFVKNIVSNKLYLYQNLSNNIAEDENVFHVYLNSNKCDWDMFPKQYQTQEYGLLAIEKNIYNTPLVIEKFQNLKKKKELWMAIANFYNEELLNPSDDLEGAPCNTPLDLLKLIANILKEDDELSLLEKINSLKDINIPTLMLEALSYSEYFKKYLSNIDIEALPENENQLPILRQEILNFHLEKLDNKSEIKVKNKI